MPFTPPPGDYPVYYQGTIYYTIPPPTPVLRLSDVIPVTPFHGSSGNRYTHGPDSYQANGSGNDRGSGNGNGFDLPPAPINGHYDYTVFSNHQNFPAPFLTEHVNHVRNVQYGRANQSNVSSAHPAAPPWSDWYHRSNSEWKNGGKKRQNRKKYGKPDQNKQEELQENTAEINGDGELNGTNGVDGGGDGRVSGNGVLADDAARTNGDGRQTKGHGPRNNRRWVNARQQTNNRQQTNDYTAINGSDHANGDDATNGDGATNGYHHAEHK